MRKTMQKCSRYSGSFGFRISDFGFRIATVSTLSLKGQDRLPDLWFEQMFGNGWIYGESSIGAVPLSLSPLVSLSLKQSDKGHSGLPSPCLLVSSPGNRYELIN